jgi:glycosyltransferase involved in cell wall biosynthesis
MPSQSSDQPIRYSVVVPVYKNAATLPAVVDRLADIASRLDAPLEAVFVVDGSPDDSLAILRELLPSAPIPSQLVALSRNFGSFPAIGQGLERARGEFVAVMAADLQEPAELIERFFDALRGGDVDVAVGRREGRDDPVGSRLTSGLFWSLYRRSVNRELPPGGVDIFACTRAVAQTVTSLRESHSSLVGLLYWVGYRRVEVPYARLPRSEGTSGWTLKKKLAYLSDSVYSFTALPIKALVWIGALGMALTVVVAIVVLAFWLRGDVTVDGYVPMMLAILFSAFVSLWGLGVVGDYVWRTFENSKARPPAIVMSHEDWPRGG